MLAVEMRKRGIKPEWEVFSPTHILQDTAALIEAGLDEEPYFINLVMGISAFQNAMPYTARNLQTMVDLLPKGAIFGVSGIGNAQLPAAMNALLLGGHVRVGLEDSLWDGPGTLARSNAAQVKRVRGILEGLSLDIASPDDAREILQLKGGDQVAF